MQVWSWTAEYLSLHGIENDKLRELAEHWQAISAKTGGGVPEATNIAALSPWPATRMRALTSALPDAPLTHDLVSST